MTTESKQVTPAKTGREMQRPLPRTLSMFDEMDRMMDRMLEGFFPRGLMRPFREWPELSTMEARIPRVDVIDREEDILVRAELPGVDKKDLDVSVRDSTVSIRATSAQEQQEEAGEYYRHEVARGAFMRTIPLPTDVDGDKAKASFKDGILELTLPKVERAKARRLTID
jgi:HSP20 family protein